GDLDHPLLVRADRPSQGLHHHRHDPRRHLPDRGRPDHAAGQGPALHPEHARGAQRNRGGGIRLQAAGVRRVVRLLPSPRPQAAGFHLQQLKNGSRYPLIGLPTLAIPGASPPRYGVNQAYVRALEAAGAAPVLIPPLDDGERVRAIYDRLDGMVLPGGSDVAPEEYREERIGELNKVDEQRDRRELELARWAIRDDLPTLGICRGQQVLNVALGGSLYQDLREQKATDLEHSHL